MKKVFIIFIAFFITQTCQTNSEKVKYFWSGARSSIPGDMIFMYETNIEEIEKKPWFGFEEVHYNSLNKVILVKSYYITIIESFEDLIIKEKERKERIEKEIQRDIKDKDGTIGNNEIKNEDSSSEKRDFKIKIEDRIIESYDIYEYDDKNRLKNIKTFSNNKNIKKEIIINYLENKKKSFVFITSYDNDGKEFEKEQYLLEYDENDNIIKKTFFYKGKPTNLYILFFYKEKKLVRWEDYIKPDTINEYAIYQYNGNNLIKYFIYSKEGKIIYSITPEDYK